ncbi:MAG: aconitate hydratase [Anaerolineae bacterium]
MGKSLIEKLLTEHLVEGKVAPGQEIAIAIDQTLTQDATGTLAYLQFQSLGIERVGTELSVSYVDHNLLQTEPRSTDDHRYLQSVAAKYGLYFSRPGNGICHQVHLERFGVPGKTLLGSDSHTPVAGALGMLAIGAGGLDVALAMAGAPFYLTVPEVIGVRLRGRWSPWVTAKDLALELLRRLTVKGGVGKAMEYCGEGVAALSVPERATVAGMGAELGAITSIFPSDGRTLAFLRAQGREQDWRPLAADTEAAYDEVIEVDLSHLESLIAQPSSPDKVVPVREVEGIPVAQVCIGGCINSSYLDLARVAAILAGKRVHPQVSLTISPGSRQVLTMLAKESMLASLFSCGARILEAACGPCIGMGQAPPSGGVSVRSFTRNFKGRSGTPDDLVYLASPEVCAATALRGELSDPRRLGEPPSIPLPSSFPVDEGLIIPPPENPQEAEVVMGPHMALLPRGEALPDRLEGQVLLVVRDDVTTDQISPAGAQFLPLRSNIPDLSRFLFHPVDPTFARRAKEAGGGFVVAGYNYGQGSSREHAALGSMFLGIRAVLAQSFARIHKANLVNFGILPLVFADESQYGALGQGEVLRLSGLRQALKTGRPLWVERVSGGDGFWARYELTPRQMEILLAGGLLNYMGEGWGG